MLRHDHIQSRLRAAVLLPIITIEDRHAAVPLARAIAAGGLPMIEVTLRHAGALDVVRAIANEVPEIEIGAGTVRTARQIDDAIAAGARFLVSPGLTPDLARAAKDAPVDFIPGVSTASEAMTAGALGFSVLKFFPAEAVGGAPALEALAGPLPDIFFCPTGGIGADKVARYLKLPNVICVGGSWIAPPEAVKSGNWSKITSLAKSVKKTEARV